MSARPGGPDDPAVPTDDPAVPPDRPAVPTDRFERFAVAALAGLLPAGFRERQRAEWTGDLAALAGSAPGERRRYLFAAAWTLPALRGAARRAGLATAPAVAEAVPVPYGIVPVLARVLLIGLGWPVVSYLVAVPLRYLLFDPAGLVGPGGQGTPIDPKDLWPGGVFFWLLFPVIIALSFGAYVAILGGPLLIGSLGVAGVITGITDRRRGRLRAVVALAGLAVVLPLVATMNSGVLFRPDIIEADNGYGLGLLGLVAVALGLLVRGLRRRMRAGLAGVGLAAVAIMVLVNTELGAQMRGWFLD